MHTRHKHASAWLAFCCNGIEARDMEQVLHCSSNFEVVCSTSRPPSKYTELRLSHVGDLGIHSMYIYHVYTRCHLGYSLCRDMMSMRYSGLILESSANGLLASGSRVHVAGPHLFRHFYYGCCLYTVEKRRAKRAAT